MNIYQQCLMFIVNIHNHRHHTCMTTQSMHMKGGNERPTTMHRKSKHAQNVFKCAQRTTWENIHTTYSDKKMWKDFVVDNFIQSYWSCSRITPSSSFDKYLHHDDGLSEGNPRHLLCTVYENVEQIWFGTERMRQIFQTWPIFLQQVTWQEFQ